MFPDLKTNLLTTILVGALGVMALTGVVALVVMGRPNLDAIEPAERGAGSEFAVDTPETRLAELDSYAVITERPVFFEDRRLPVVEQPTGEELAEEEVADEPEAVEGLKARIAGIIITPEVKLAMVNDQVGNSTQLLREGMSLEGEQAAWRLAEIRPRSVRFEAVDGQQADLELEVETRALAGSAAPRPAASRRGNVLDTGESAADSREEEMTDAEAEARARAEEVRRRVAERRAQLRAEAERRAREQRDQ